MFDWSYELINQVDVFCVPSSISYLTAFVQKLEPMSLTDPGWLRIYVVRISAFLINYTPASAEDFSS